MRNDSVSRKLRRLLRNLPKLHLGLILVIVALIAPMTLGELHRQMDYYFDRYNLIRIAGFDFVNVGNLFGEPMMMMSITSSVNRCKNGSEKVLFERQRRRRQMYVRLGMH